MWYNCRKTKLKSTKISFSFTGTKTKNSITNKYLFGSFKCWNGKFECQRIMNSWMWIISKTFQTFKIGRTHRTTMVCLLLACVSILTWQQSSKSVKRKWISCDCFFSYSFSYAEFAFIHIKCFFFWIRIKRRQIIQCDWIYLPKIKIIKLPTIVVLVANLIRRSGSILYPLTPRFG